VRVGGLVWGYSHVRSSYTGLYPQIWGLGYQEAGEEVWGKRLHAVLFRVEGSGFKNNYFTEMCSGSEEGSYSKAHRLSYHSTLGLRVIMKKFRVQGLEFGVPGEGFRLRVPGFGHRG